MCFFIQLFVVIISRKASDKNGMQLMQSHHHHHRSFLGTDANKMTELVYTYMESESER